MFIECSACNSKYLINSADLKPKGRMVECASCNHQWFQEPNFNENIISESINFLNDSDEKEIHNKKINENINKKKNNKIKNLPSTVVKEQKVSILNSFLVVAFLVLIIFSFLFLRSYGINIFVLINFYLQEFYFNLKLIINDISKIIYHLIS
tara:strand:- start:100 stop:555 length:456 start_codon:yes stop_codon:yes gene_type:complete